MEPLRGAIRHYEWGSRTALAKLTRRPSPSRQPEAELWFGAHPGDSATVISDAGERSLLNVLRADPVRLLGSRVYSRFGPDLPFLMKVIAAAEPLSLQAHPNSAQAQHGYEKEERAGVAITDPTRNYRDVRHKPEIVIALGSFEALAGFRQVPETRRLLQALAFFDYDCVLDSPEPEHALWALFSVWMTATREVIERDVNMVLAGAMAYLNSGNTEFAAECTMLLKLGEHYPGDPGILVATLLNRIPLSPGEALFLPAGNIHAYLHGVAVEVMANSDNVLRGGLTNKHVDVAELLSILDFSPIDEIDLRPPMHRIGPRLLYQPPVGEFAVSRWVFDGSDIGRETTAFDSEGGPHIFLCTEGSVSLIDPESSVHLESGDGVWVPDCDWPVRMIANRPSTVFSAGVPDA